MRLLRLGMVLLALCWCGGLLGGLCACHSPGEANPFAYADAAFSASIRGTYIRVSDASSAAAPMGEDRAGVPVPIAAVVAFGAPAADGVRPLRPLTVTFSEPPALAGATVTRDAAGEVTLVFPGGLTLSDAAGTYDSLLRFAEALLPRGDTVAVTPWENGSRTVTTASSARRAEFLFSKDVRLPLCVVAETPTERLELRISEATE